MTFETYGLGLLSGRLSSGGFGSLSGGGSGLLHNKATGPLTRPSDESHDGK